MKSRKVQVTLEEPDYQALLRVAERENKKLAAVVRESIEKYCVEPESARERRASLTALFSIDAPVVDTYETWERQYSALKAEALEVTEATAASATDRTAPAKAPSKETSHPGRKRRGGRS
jgi:hypothetical protein